MLGRALARSVARTGDDVHETVEQSARLNLYLTSLRVREYHRRAQAPA